MGKILKKIEKEGLFLLLLSEDKKQMDIVDEADMYIMPLNKKEVDGLIKELRELYFKMKD